MQTYLENNLEVVRYVADQLADLDNDCPLTMTIIRKKSGGYSASTVTDTSLDDTVEKLAGMSYSGTQVYI